MCYTSWKKTEKYIKFWCTIYKMSYRQLVSTKKDQKGHFSVLQSYINKSTYLNFDIFLIHQTCLFSTFHFQDNLSCVNHNILGVQCSVRETELDSTIMRLSIEIPESMVSIFELRRPSYHRAKH